MTRLGRRGVAVVVQVGRDDGEGVIRARADAAAATAFTCTVRTCLSQWNKDCVVAAPNARFGHSTESSQHSILLAPPFITAFNPMSGQSTTNFCPSATGGHAEGFGSAP